MNAPEFESRWLIVGTLTTRSELHIGDGGAGAIHDRTRPAKKNVPGKEDESDANTVCTDHAGRAYLPGSGMKGALRELVMIPNPTDPQNKPPMIHPDWKDLLGSDKPDATDAVGGKLEFRDAFLVEEGLTSYPSYAADNALSSEDRPRPWWDDTRRTCVAVSVSLDRRTRTAKENLLYHLEYVPPGEKFDFEIGGDDLSGEEVARLLVLLDRLADGAVTLGAQASNGWGRLAIGDYKIHCLNADGMKEWKENPTGPPALPPIDEKRRKEIELAKKDITLPSNPDLLTIDLKLILDSPWLIRDPRQRERSEAAKNKNLDEKDKPRDAVPIQDESGKSGKSGKPFLPAKSLRGSLRSRAEMILRTLDFKIANHPGDIKPKSTKGGGDVVADIRKMPDLAAKLFGLGGWRAPIHVPRFTATGDVAEHPQEFVAIDRFTGGAAEGAKFNADLADPTSLTGTLTIDLARLRKVDPDFASLGLLALVLRDLAEGDIPIGSGSSKGQGFCTAEATVVYNGEPFDSLNAWFSSQTVTDALAVFRNANPAAASGNAPATATPPPGS